MIDNAVSKQQDWLARRSSFATDFFYSLNVFAKPSATKRNIGRPAVKTNAQKNQNRVLVREYWFPVLCTFLVVFMTINILLQDIKSWTPNMSPIPEPIIRTVPNNSITPNIGEV